MSRAQRLKRVFGIETVSRGFSRLLALIASVFCGNRRRVSLREFLREGEVRDFETGVPARGSWVRIPPSPPVLLSGRAGVCAGNRAPVTRGPVNHLAAASTHPTAAERTGIGGHARNCPNSRRTGIFRAPAQSSMIDFPRHTFRNFQNSSGIPKEFSGPCAKHAYDRFAQHLAGGCGRSRMAISIPQRSCHN